MKRIRIELVLLLAAVLLSGGCTYFTQEWMGVRHIYELGPEKFEKQALEQVDGYAICSAVGIALVAAADTRFDQDGWLQVAIRLQLRMQKGWPGYRGNSAFDPKNPDRTANVTDPEQLRLSLERTLRITYWHGGSIAAGSGFNPRIFDKKVGVAFMEAIKPSPNQIERYNAWQYYYPKLAPEAYGDEEPPVTQTYFEIDPAQK